MNWPQVMWRVILPQAARIAVPPLSNTFIPLVKDTSLAAAVTVPELFQAAQRLASVTEKVVPIMAAIFLLGVLPLVTLGQLGLIVGSGVMVDTLVVRTVIVPAIFSLTGDRIWWPGKLHARKGESTHESRTPSIDVH